MKKCLLCDETEALTKHHVWPQEFDGITSDGRVLLCENCHGLIDANIPYNLNQMKKLMDMDSKSLWLIVVRLHSQVMALRAREDLERKIVRLMMFSQKHPENVHVKKKLEAALDDLFVLRADNKHNLKDKLE